MDNKIQQLKQLINESNNIVFFGGAGVSTESGIPDFRSKDGLYHQEYDYPPEEILSHTFFINHTDEFYRFYKDKMNSLNYEPNIAHFQLVDLENRGNNLVLINRDSTPYDYRADLVINESLGKIFENIIKYNVIIMKFYVII